MSIIYETEIVILGESHDNEKLAITHIFERGDFRNRDDVLKVCLKEGTRFQISKFQSITLVLPNVQVEDTKINRHLGIQSILEKQFKISIPNGKRSETLKEENGKLVFTCGIVVPISNIDLTVHVLSRFRNSVLIFGNYPSNSEILYTILNKSKHLQDSDRNSWLPLASYLISQDLSCVRFFGLFDDV